MQSQISGNDAPPQLQHEIFVLDAYLQQPLDESCMEEITVNLTDHLLDALRMEKLGKLEIYPAADLRAPGWSFLQPITTSHISGHYFEKPGKHPHIRMDLYSCKTVNWRKVLSVVHENLSLGAWRATFIDRQIDEAMHRMIMDISGKGDLVTSEVVIQADLHTQSAKEPIAIS